MVYRCEKITIIVPIYKVEDYLFKCVNSILKQTYKDIEVILVDDGSPDKCPAICDEFVQKDSRVKVIHQKNSGVSAARNAGLKMAQGEYIGFVDPDDWVDSDMYAEMLVALKQSAAELAVCGYNYYHENGDVDPKRLYPISSNELISQKELMKRFSDMPPTVRHGVCNKLFRKDILNDIYFDETLHSAEDVMFLNEYVKRIKKAVFVHKPLYNNLVRQGSATHGGLSIESLIDSFKAHQLMYTTAITLYPDLKNCSQAFFLDVCMLKYNEAKAKLLLLKQDQKTMLKPKMRTLHFQIKKEAFKAIFNREIYWKTRISYLLK